MRNLHFTPEFREFRNNSNQRVKSKIDDMVHILEDAPILHSKYVKKLVSAIYYELRISADNEVRIILFSVDNPNISLAGNIVLLNGFIKKSNKDYKKAIEKADRILTDYIS